MKKTIKIVSILLIALMMVTIATPVFAADDGTDNNKPSQMITIDMNNTDSVKTVGGSITGVIRVVGTIVAVAVLIVLGIKYMMGSAEEKAEYKKTLFPYIIGAVLIFAASQLADIIYNWATTIQA